MKRIIIRCANCQYSEEYTYPLVTCPACGGTYMEADYELDEPLPWPAALKNRPDTMWRYRELLPIRDDANILTMGEGGTPLLRSENLAAMLGLRHLYIKDERQGPTGSFKDRQASLAISTMREIGVKEAVVASTGNVAIAYAAYAARAKIKMWVFTISSVPVEKMREVTIYGAELVKVTGTYDQAKQVASHFADSKGLFLDRGIKSLAAKESMKTMAFEIAAQLAEIYGPTSKDIPWRAPDWYIQSVSGGLGPVGLMKGFRELEQFALCQGFPKLANIQSSGCDPMVRAFKAGQEEAPPFLKPSTRIATVATDVPGIAYTILRKEVLEHGGIFESVPDEESFQALKTIAQLEGLSVEPATALAFAGLFKMVRQKMIDPDEIVVLNCSGHTFPVEKHILGEELIRDLDVASVTQPAIPHEGLLTALETVDRRVGRVVVIEDDPGASKLMARILRAHGVRDVYLAPDGEAGIEMVQSVRPDIIVLDLMMPGMDGFGVLDELKSDETLRDVPVVIVTAKDLTTDERARLAGQVQGLLQKGSLIEDDVLKELIDKTLG
ncbi:MAG: pyridoxal-phosphate dependent enzyme [Anaerolineae bacterium]|nr:pyridoxal-phosphate dependent enzyme [Anaerolineae bacterium]